MLIEKPRCNFNNCRYCFDGNCYSADKYENCKLTDLHYQIAKLTVDLDNAKQEWISVEDRLPERIGKYLVFTVDRRIYICNFINHYCHGNAQFDDYKVTHWMPLPEAPKGGAE